MGKNIKSYATTPSSFQRKREGSLTAKGPNLSFTIWYGLTVHIIRFKITSKIFKIVSPSQIPANYANSAQFACTVREFRKIRTFYIMFQAPAPAENPAKFQQITQIPRNSPTQSANSAKFAHFVNLFYIIFQAPAPTKNAQEFQRITQILRSSPTQSANYVKFAPFANTTPYVSDAWPVAENSPIPRIT